MSELTLMIATGVAVLVVGQLTAWLIIRRLRARLAEAVSRSQHDPLTGLLNRAGFADRYAAWQRARRPMILVLVDMDDFKAVNDTYGHQAGDVLLVILADRLREAASLFGGVAGRLSGDEFVVLLPAVDAGTGRSLEARRLLDALVAIASVPAAVTVDGRTVKLPVSVSAGACGGEHDETMSRLLRRADVALYHAKHNGGGSMVYRPGLTMPSPAASRRGVRLRDRHQLPLQRVGEGTDEAGERRYAKTSRWTIC